MFQHHIFNAFSSAGSYSCCRTSSNQLLASDCRFFRKMALPQEVIDRIAAFFVPTDIARILLTSSHMLDFISDSAPAPPDAVIPSTGGCRSPQGTEDVAMVEFTHQLVP